MRQGWTLIALALSCAALMMGVRAQAGQPSLKAGLVTLDFEDIACARQEAQCEVGDQYMAHGFALRYVPAVDEPMAAGLVAMGTQWKGNRKGSTALAIRSCEAQVLLMANDNQPFDVLSLDVAPLEGDGPLTIEFVGQKEDGTEVKLPVKLARKAGWQKVVFTPGFRGLSSLQWAQGACLDPRLHMMDNLTVIRPSRP